jgi:putative oxidoreductase
MKVAVLIARILLGLVFVFFGLNAFFNFLHAPMPPGLAGQFTGALFASHFYVVPFGFQILGGLLMLAGRYVSLGLVILAPILVNILTFHLTMAPGILPGLVCTLLWFVVFAAHRESFRGILSANG